MPKDPAWFSATSQTRDATKNGAFSIQSANDEEHASGRKALSHAFSERALTAQESLIQTYVKQLISQMKNVASRDRNATDMTKWYTWATFDVTSDLLFGEPFGCLRDLTMHRYVKLLMRDIQVVRLYYLIWYFPLLQPFIRRLGVIKDSGKYDAWVAQQVEERISRKSERPDFMSYILDYNEREKERALPHEKIIGNAGLILAAGSETTATLLSATTYALMLNPEVYQRLKDEVRSLWTKSDDITLDSVE